MGLRLSSQWSLVVCGLVAHADGTFDGDEIDGLMSVLDEEADPSEYGAWLETLADRSRLEELLDTLPAISEPEAASALEQAWTLTMADGEQSDDERRMLAYIAGRFRISSMTLAGWIERWTAGLYQDCELASRVAAFVLEGGEAPGPRSRELIHELVAHLPVSEPERQEILALSVLRADRAGLLRSLHEHPRHRQAFVLTRAAMLAPRASDASAARIRFFELAQAMGRSVDWASNQIRG